MIKKRKNHYYKIMTYQEKDILYKYHKENSEKIEQERIYQQHSFDNWILKLCSGSFAVSFAFIEKLIDFSVASAKFFLIIGWSSFALCLCLCVFGFFNSEKINRFAFKQEWIIYKNETENLNEKLKSNKNIFIAKVLNFINYFLFVLGVLCLIIFLAINL